MSAAVGEGTQAGALSRDQGNLAQTVKSSDFKATALPGPLRGSHQPLSFFFFFSAVRPTRDTCVFPISCIKAPTPRGMVEGQLRLNEVLR